MVNPLLFRKNKLIVSEKAANKSEMKRGVLKIGGRFLKHCAKVLNNV